MPGMKSQLSITVLALMVACAIIFLLRFDGTESEGLAESPGSTATPRDPSRVAISVPVHEHSAVSSPTIREGAASSTRIVLHGRTVDAAHVPLAAIIEVSGATTSTNRNGEFSIALTPPLIEPVSVRAVGYEPLAINMENIPDDGDLGVIVLLGSAAGSIRIIDSSGRPLAAERVRWMACPSSTHEIVARLPQFIEAGHTDANGMIHLEGLPASGRVALAIGRHPCFPRIEIIEGDALPQAISTASLVDATIAFGPLLVGRGGVEISLSVADDLSVTSVVDASLELLTAEMPPGHYEARFFTLGGQVDLQNVLVTSGARLAPRFVTSRVMKVFVTEADGAPVPLFEVAAYPVEPFDPPRAATVMGLLDRRLGAKGADGVAAIMLCLLPGDPQGGAMVAVKSKSGRSAIVTVAIPPGDDVVTANVILPAPTRITVRCEGVPSCSLLRVRRLRYADDSTAEPERPVVFERRLAGQPEIDIALPSGGEFLLTVAESQVEVDAARVRVQDESTTFVAVDYSPSSLVIESLGRDFTRVKALAVARLAPPGGWNSHEHIEGPVIFGVLQDGHLCFPALSSGRYLVAPPQDLFRMPLPYSDSRIVSVRDATTYYWDDEIERTIVVTLADAGGYENVFAAIVPRGRRYFAGTIPWRSMGEGESVEFSSAIMEGMRLVMAKAIPCRSEDKYARVVVLHDQLLAGISTESLEVSLPPPAAVVVNPLDGELVIRQEKAGSILSDPEIALHPGRLALPPGTYLVRWKVAGTRQERRIELSSGVLTPLPSD